MKCNPFKKDMQSSTNGLYIISTNTDTPAPTIFRDLNNISATPRPIAPLIISINVIRIYKIRYFDRIVVVKYNEKD